MRNLYSNTSNLSCRGQINPFSGGNPEALGSLFIFITGIIMMIFIIAPAVNSSNAIIFSRVTIIIMFIIVTIFITFIIVVTIITTTINYSILPPSSVPPLMQPFAPP
ncbi:hypothetical protein ElyMa_003463800 [Elysia marginata]|uniref:NADH dehydrogenase subunit 6 n=1 Tax=Elysia marginata TaxID=1093978 RepID=A0AAV4EAT1_9GAST|nr:hypothetical protein ElyMa_003463800 [Elysia marginata]